MYSDSRNPFGLLNGQLVTINDVSSGLSCGCLCPQCKQPLVARKGDQKIHHFSHHKKTDCSGGLETALHIKSKEIFLKHKAIMLPAVPGQLSLKRTVHRYPSNCGPWMLRGRCYSVSEQIINQFFYESVFIESKIGSIRPDVVLFGDRPFVIELYVTHKTGFEKIREIKKLGLFGVEIDLRYLRRLDLLDEKLIENAVIHCTHTKKWISV